MKKFIAKITAVTDIDSLEVLREQLVIKAPSIHRTWQSRMRIYEKINLIVARLMELEDERAQNEQNGIKSSHNAVGVETISL